MKTIWDILVRWRTWFLGVATALVTLLPELLSIASLILNDPKIVAILPADTARWAGAIGAVLMIWSRFRPATRAADPEVQVKRALKDTDYPATVVVEAGGETKAVIDA